VRTEIKTLVISDIHLGTKGSRAKELVRFLKQFKCNNLILNGDIIDGWQLRKSGKWKKKHTRFFRRILAMIEEDNTQVYYLRGNHDDFLDQVMPFKMGNLHIVNDLVYESNTKKYYIIHGDIFDTITRNFRWIAKLGDMGYTFLLWFNRMYNFYRRKNGLPYFSLSQLVKSKVKTAVSYIDDFETQLSDIAKAKNCDGVICGHIHQPANKMLGDIHYMNSGDWVESLSALVEDFNGEWNLIYYSETGKSAIREMKPQLAENDSVLENLLYPNLAGLSSANGQ
jgi:UDP-2,3-diacylglucosamine pyrophosphatase LpxH